MNEAQIEALVRELAALPGEAEWVEFKHNLALPVEIGEYISALANSSALCGKPAAYVVWGIEDGARRIVGTSFRPRETKVGNEALENWLAHQLTPRIDVQWHELKIDGLPIVLLAVQPATHRPVRFKGAEYIRIGSYKKKLQDYPEKERELRRVFDRVPFEKGVAKPGASSDEVLSLLDYPNYFRLMNQPLPDNRAAILDRLVAEAVLVRAAGGTFDVSNVGAILLARNLRDFELLSRKALRVIIYRGENRIQTIKEQMSGKGYAIGFEEAISYINDQLPQNEQMGQALRSQVRMYPEITIRELVANALIHQDLNVTGAGPMVEIFGDRMEVSNPGAPLIDTLRFIDQPPRSRNEMMAALMRRMNICEERGSGIDKVIFHVEMFQLPAPDFRVAGDSTVAVLFGPRKFLQMDREERRRACYQHACLQFVSGKRMSNATLRKRLGIKDSNYPLASRIIRDAIDAGLIRPHGGAEGARKDSTYVPFWG
jgi:predicted HTH transcriptional regulator